MNIRGVRGPKQGMVQVRADAVNGEDKDRVRDLRKGRSTRGGWSVINFEVEFEERLEHFDRDSRHCAIFGYTGRAIDYVGGSDADILGRLNEHGLFWRAIVGALQSATFVSLGRVFDTGRGKHSAHALLEYAETYPGIFSRKALEARRIGAGNDPQAVEVLVSRAFEPTPDSFRPLRGELDRHQQFFNDYVAPIRDNVFAHTGQLQRSERDELFANLRVHHLEELLVFPLRMHRALWELYHNGREPVLEDAPRRIAEVLASLQGPSSNWEHQEFVEDTATFLRRLRLEGEEPD
jgi:hypothetical protein